jgi:uncharacterized LabA/DUF88 family protein
VARFYARKLRATIAARNGTDEFDAEAYAHVGVPGGAALNGAVVLTPERIAVDAIMTEDVAEVTGVADAVEGAEGEQRRRRRRRGRGRGRRDDEVVAVDAAETGILPEDPGFAEEAEAEVEAPVRREVPPSSYLAEMVQAGSLVLPEQRRRGRGRGRFRDDGPSEMAMVPAAEQPAMPVPSMPRGKARSAEELLMQQNVLLDLMLQRQTALLKTMEQAMTSLLRRGGGGGAGGAIAAQQRAAVFVDVPNIVYAADRIGVEIDWGKVLNFLTRNRQLVRATAYAPVTDDPRQRMEMQRFVQPFYNLPYRILTKPLKRFGNGEIKANFDVELAIDVITMADRLDVVCLVSGDGDFRRMVELAQVKGSRVEVLAFSSSTAGELRTVCDDYIDFTQHLDELCVTK